MSESVKISLIVPVHDAGDSLRPCLDSICAQTLKDIEIICVLDCPSDGSDKTVYEYARRDGRFKVIANSENLHIGNSRNVGLVAASGKYIAFCDHDDTLDEDFLRCLYDISEKKEYPVIGSLDSFVNQPDSDTLVLHKVRNAFVDILSGKLYFFTPSVWTNIYERSFIERHSVRFADTRNTSIEDAIFNCEVFSHILSEDINAEFPIVNRHFYHHKKEHTNGSYAHRSMKKILSSCEYLGNCCKKSGVKDISSTYSDGIVRFLYLSLKKELVHNGLFKGMKSLSLVSDYPNVVEALKNHNFFYNRKLTLPKNLFFHLLKCYVR